jgi:NitT/TauT family transport system substrate-binding protein
MTQNRRRFLATLSATGAAGFIGAARSFGQEPALETTTVRLSKINGTCIAPQYLAEEFLRLEGFTDVQYVLSNAGVGQSRSIARGEVDFSMNFAAPLVIPIDAGEPITIIAGVHSGCFELFGNEHVRGIADLKGRAVGVQGLGGSPHARASGDARTQDRPRDRQQRYRPPVVAVLLLHACGQQRIHPQASSGD